MTRNEVFPRKYLIAADLQAKPRIVTIERAPAETLKNPEGKEQTKTVLYFNGAKKSFPLNMTNWDACAAICGDDTEDWPGCSIELYPTTTTMAGKTIDCIRVRAPAQHELPVQGKKPAQKKPPNDDLDDAIPF
jgi:hypothetical protein